MNLVTLFLCVFVLFSVQDAGLKFDEIMKGYFSFGEMDYEKAYQEGKKRNQEFNFTITSIIPSIENFIKDPNHSTLVSGSIQLNSSPLPVSSNSKMELFVKGSGRIVHMKYYIEFELKNEKYHLEGIKNMNGADCLNLPNSATTLYSKVRKGHSRGQGEVYVTGIVMIGVLDTLKLAQSIRPYKEGGWPVWIQFITGVGRFLSFVVTTMGRECFTLQQTGVQFWYIWSSDEKGNGYLLDLIKRPRSVHLRLANWSDENLELFKSNFTLDQFRSDREGNIQIGPLLLTKNSCKGNVENVKIETFNHPSRLYVNMVPNWITSILPILPMIESNYTTLSQDSFVHNIKYSANQPMVYTKYTIPFFIGFWEWSMISAMKFEGTDLKLEMMGLYFARNWIVQSFIYYKGKSHTFTNPIYMVNKFNKTGELEGDKRYFIGSIKSNDIHFEIHCESLGKDFILLESEGSTDIYTSLKGKCIVEDKFRVERYTSQGNVLLERKMINPN